DLAARDDGHPLVEQLGERADHAGLRLAALAEEDDVVPGDERVLELRQDGVLVADDPVDELLALRDARDRVAAHLLLDRSRRPAALLQLAEGPGTGHGATPASKVVSVTVSARAFGPTGDPRARTAWPSGNRRRIPRAPTGGTRPCARSSGCCRSPR